MQSAESPIGLEPFREPAIRRRLAEMVGKAVASAEIAYSFAPGSYTAQALSDLQDIRKLLGCIDDLGAK
jgi:hypothetical protein